MSKNLYSDEDVNSLVRILLEKQKEIDGWIKLVGELQDLNTYQNKKLFFINKELEKMIKVGGAVSEWAEGLSDDIAKIE